MNVYVVLHAVTALIALTLSIEIWRRRGAVGSLFVALLMLAVATWALTYRDGQAPISVRLGIDPWGGADPHAEHVVWSPGVETGGNWARFAVSARAQTDRVTVFLEHDQDAANPWNVSAFDGLELLPGP